MAEAGRVKLSHRSIEALQPKAKRFHVYDEPTPGLAVCVTPKGRKVFYWIGRVSARPSRVQIGPYPQIPLERARNEAKRIAGDAAGGMIPHTRKQRINSEWTLRRVFQNWMDTHSKPHKKTWARDIRQFDLTLADWQHLPLAGITKAMIAAKHVDIGTKAGPYAGNKMLELLRTLFNHAINQLDWPGSNPTKAVRRYATTERDRFLQTDEIPRFFRAVAKLKRPVSRDFFMLCLFTGARRSNVCSMRWSDVNMDRREWKVAAADHKNKQPIIIALSDPAMEILKRRKESAACDWVLPGQGSRGHYSDPKGAWEQIKKTSGIGNLRIHDLRRTLGSWQAMAGSSLVLIAKSLGHVSLKSTQVYARLQMDPVRESVTAATDAMMSAALRESTISKNVPSPSSAGSAPSSAGSRHPAKRAKRPQK